jgi:hypothetical protein
MDSRSHYIAGMASMALRWISGQAAAWFEPA